MDIIQSEEAFSLKFRINFIYDDILHQFLNKNFALSPLNSINW